MINTIILKLYGDESDNEKLKQGARALKEGKLVVFPTETVYGLGANGLDAQAAHKIYEAKGRPSDNPLILHISNKEQLLPLVSNIPSLAQKLMEKFWPGPLTMIFEKSSIVPKEVTGGLDTVAIRMPSHPIACRLIEESKLPIAAPSANLSGKPSPTKAEHVKKDLMGRVDIIIEGEHSDIGLESTIVDVTGDIPVILRPGGITLEDITEVVGSVEVDKGIIGDLDKEYIPKAPGMKYTHYAPNAPMTMVLGSGEKVVKKIKDLTKTYIENNKRVGILTTNENIEKYNQGVILSVGKRDKPETIAMNLFDCLRQFDEKEVDIILAEGVEDKGIGMAIFNRMNKAAGHQIIRV